MNLNTVQIGRDGMLVVLSVNGRSTTMPYEKAEEIGRALIKQAKQAETLGQVDRVIDDHAFALRAGLSFGFSNHPDIQAEAAKEAAWGTQLRKEVPSFRGTGQVGIPVVRQPSQRSSGS